MDDTLHHCLDDLRLWIDQERERGTSRFWIDAQRVEQARAQFAFAERSSVTSAPQPEKKARAKPALEATESTRAAETAPAKKGQSAPVVPPAESTQEAALPPARVRRDREVMERKAAALAALDAQQVAVCTKCGLHETRTHTVFGVGHPDADVVFVGEAPGADEDAKGEPFVGRAGKLLTKIIQAIGFEREDVYILNVLKCRPPGNRNPNPDEVGHCEPYLLKQLEILQPKVIMALGKVSASTLLRSNDALGKMRRQVHDYNGIPMMVTYHPAALLRNPGWKRATWEDVRKLREMYDELTAS